MRFFNPSGASAATASGVMTTVLSFTIASRVSLLKWSPWMSVTSTRSGTPYGLNGAAPPTGSTNTVLPFHLNTTVPCLTGCTSKSPLAVLILSAAWAVSAPAKASPKTNRVIVSIQHP